MALLSGLRLDSGIISFDFKPSVGILARDIDLLGMRLSTFREPLQRSIVEVMIPSIRKNFEAEGRPGWTPMAESTRLIRARLGGSGSSRLLHKTGALQAAATSESLWSVTDVFAAVKALPASVSYGNVHQEGYGGMGRQVKAHMKRGASPAAAAKAAMKALDKKILSGGMAGGGGGSTVNIPARPFVLFQDEDEDAIMEIFDLWLAEQLAILVALAVRAT
jgi:phage gpG-like protein